VTRIVAGSVGGRRLETPPGGRTRPTSDRVREALFSRVESLLGGLDETAVLDLYAGSGAVGLEALSRGAAKAVLVEADRRTAALVSRNADALGLADRAVVVVGPVERVLAGQPAVRAGFVYADPPYDSDPQAVRGVVAQALTGGWCTTDALLVVERSRRSGPWRFPPDVDALDSRRYGDTTLWYGRRARPAGRQPSAGEETTCTSRSAPGPSTR